MCLLIVASAMVSATAVQERPFFRSTAHLVQIDVSVRQQGRSISDLELVDFGLTDNGVAQSINRVSYDRSPLDILLVADCSPSMVRSGEGWLARGIREIESLKMLDDQVRILPFSASASLTQSDASLKCGIGHALGTALFDAAVAATLLPTDHRKRLVVILTDGANTTSLLPASARSQIVDRSNALVYAIALTPERPARWTGTFMWTPSSYRADRDWELREFAQRAGGDLLTVPPEQDFVSALTAAVEDARHRYVLQYVPEGVQSGGWHDVKVTVKRHSRAEVRAKRGYWRE